MKILSYFVFFLCSISDVTFIPTFIFSHPPYVTTESLLSMTDNITLTIHTQISENTEKKMKRSSVSESPTTKKARVDGPAPSHLSETHNVGDTQPTAPQMPSCEICDQPAQLQCGVCVELFFCDKPACYDACHPRPRDREAHRASVTAYGTSSKCAHHPDQVLCLVCVDPACGDALICMRCDKCDTHAGHKTVDITDYMKRQRDTLCSHVTDLTTQRTAAEEKCGVLEALPPTESRYKDLLLQTRVGHFVMREDVSRSEVVCEEELARSFLTQALSREGEVCALKTFVAKAGHMIAECEAVCQLGDDQVLRAVTESQAVVRSINSMAASGDRHRLVGAAHPHATFSLKLPVSNVHDALAQMSALVMPVLVQGLDGVEHEIEVSVDDTGRDLRRKVASAVGLREDGFDMTFRDEAIAEGEDVVQLRGHRVVVTQTNAQRTKQDAIAALRALGETTLTRARLKQVNDRRSDPKVTCLLLQAGVATAIPDNFFSRTTVTCIDLSHASAVTVIGNEFLRECKALTKVDLSGLQAVTAIGNRFLSRCESLSTLDLSGLRGVTRIGNSFLYGCYSLSTVDLSGFKAVTAIGGWFLSGCDSLSSVDLSAFEGVTRIEEHFLCGCSSLSTVDLRGLQGVTSIESAFLFECEALTTVDMSALRGVTSIEYSFLGECSSLSTVDLSGLQCVTWVDGGLFEGCTSLKTLHGKDKCSNAVLSSIPQHLRH